MVSHKRKFAKKVPGLITPVLFLCCVLSGVSAAQAQQPVQPNAQPPISSRPVPGSLELSKLIWSTMAAIDHANQSGNYSVLRDISAPGFQILNNATQLSQVFASIRNSRIDLSNTMLLAPTYTAPPQIVQQDVMRVQGYFGLRPTAIVFDFYYQWVQGKWRLYGVSVVPQTIATTEPQGN